MWKTPLAQALQPHRHHVADSIYLLEIFYSHLSHHIKFIIIFLLKPCNHINITWQIYALNS